jgi:hypothetical protein
MTNQTWKAETDSHYGPHLRLYSNGKRTTVLILPKFVSQQKTGVPISVLEKLKKLVQAEDAKPF